MRFTTFLSPVYLDALGDDKEGREDKLLEIIQQTLWSTTLPQNQERNITVEFDDLVTIDIDMDSGTRDPETVKDILFEAFVNFFDPEYTSDIEVEINNEL
jgi:hypothetical protein